MADYKLATQSFFYGLSDFWLRFFKETETLEYFYRGAEIQVGQAYLDLLSLILNNSLQDATVFNKEYFKLITIREDEIQFIPGVTTGSNRYRYVLPDNIVQVAHLNNKILLPTDALDKNVNYYISDNGVERQLDFIVDPTNAYYELVVGNDIASLKIRSKFPGTEGGLITIFMNDNGSSSINITRTEYAITVSYDGYFNGATHSVRELVQAINTNELVNPLIVAEAVNDTINGSPSGTGFPIPLEIQDSNPLDNFGKRKITAQFGGSFTTSLIPSWTRAGVRKGDILRLRSGRGIGQPVELDIDLLQGSKLYVNQNTPIPEDSEVRMDFAVLREPANNVSENEALANSGSIVQSGIGGAAVNPATREVTIPLANFKLYHVGDVLNILTGLNIGSYRITAVTGATIVEIGATNLVLESGLSWEHLSIVDPTKSGLTATINLLTANTAEVITDLPALPPTPDEVTGTVLKIVINGTLYRYDITGFDAAGPFTRLYVKGTFPVTAPVAEWATTEFTPNTTVVLSPPAAWPRTDTAMVIAYRALDDQLVEPGRDYRFYAETGILEPLTVWRTSNTNTVTYKFALAVVQTVTPVQQGLLGSITPGNPSIFTAADANFLPEHVGFGINVSNSAFTTGITNNGTFHIKAILSTTSVELVRDKIPNTSPDINNGSLVWSMHMRGSSIPLADSATVFQLAFWAPDILVDRFHLYNTFGYLINKYSRSSEQYRSFIRGVFQLFILGPTLERFESAVNILAGLPVVRDDNEVLMDYQTDALYSASNGNVSGVDNSFTTLTYTFTTADLNKVIYIASGFNTNKIFTITSIVNTNKVLLNTSPITETNVVWELRNPYALQTVVTSRNRYTFTRTIPVKAKYQDPSNFGILTLRSFEVISAIFTVTDEVETPRWWSNTIIPKELWLNESIDRRTSTPQLFENSVAPGDGGRIGDPGFRIGADDEGFVPPSSLLAGRSGITNGTIVGDPFYPTTNTTYFDCLTGNFTQADVGNILIIIPPTVLPVTSYRIIGVISTTRIQLESFIELPLSTTGLSWEIHSGALPLRHKAAYVVLDQYLKAHLFTISFDFAALNVINTEFLTDLQKLIFQAKPSYTYLIVNPYAFFNELIKINEEFILTSGIYPAGTGGEVISANENPLLIIGSSWPIGQWYRYLENLSSFVTPAVTVPNMLGIPAPGFNHHLSKVSLVKGPTFPDNITASHADFTSSSIPIQFAERISLLEAGPYIGDASIVVAGSDITLTVGTPTFTLSHVLGIITLTGSGAGNDGDYIIGEISSPTTVNISRPVPTTTEAGLTWSLFLKGDQQGTLKITTGGAAIFRSYASAAVMSIANEASLRGNHLRRTVVGKNITNDPINYEAYRLHSREYSGAEGADVWFLYNKNRTEPLSTKPDAVGNLTITNQLTVTSADILFSENMGQNNRFILDDTTYLKTRFFIEFTSGVNSGISAEVMSTLDPLNVILDPLAGLAADPAAQFFIYRLNSYDVVTEPSLWEVIRPLVLLDGNTLDLTNTPAQDPDTVNYRSYGVREPIDPTLSIFDDTLGDTLYYIGMPDPKPAQGRSRTSYDVDFREDPIQVTRI